MRDPLEAGLGPVLAARANVYRHLGRTPLLRHPGLCELPGAEVYLKHENHHAAGVFKVRGGVNPAAHLDDHERRAGLVTASTGNHGQSIAFAGQLTATPVCVAVPEGANPAKCAAMRRLGAEVVERGCDFDASYAWAQEAAGRRGARFVGTTEPELPAGRRVALVPSGGNISPRQLREILSRA